MMMKTLLLLMFSCVVSMANNSFYDVRCDKSVDRGLYFEPIKPIPGLYFLKWCTLANMTATGWKLRLDYEASLKPEQCHNDFFISRDLGDSDLDIHSEYFERPVQVNSNCTNVCFTTTVDAIFSSTCYQIKTWQVILRQSGHVEEFPFHYHYHYVRENDTLLTLKDIKNIYVNAEYQNDGSYVVLKWKISIPASQYEVYLTPNGTTDKVKMNCSSESTTSVLCRAAAPPGCYSAKFLIETPWVSVLPRHSFTDSFFDMQHFCVTWAVSHSQLWWALVGALLLGVLALMVIGALRAARVDTRLKQNIPATGVQEIPRRLERPRASPSPGRIVLLYARDCEHMERAAAHLAALLQLETGCEVVDLWRPATVAAWASAAAPWLRAQLQRADSRVLLLQSPATALYMTRRAPSDKEPKLEAPLLGGRASWRRPHAADPQLLLALRLLADSAHHEPLPYKKYYVATVAGLQHGEAVPALTPQRRYALPDAAAQLLHDLAPAGPPSPRSPAALHLLRQLEDTLREFRKYAQDNPDYLFHELVLG